MDISQCIKELWFIHFTFFNQTFNGETKTFQTFLSNIRGDLDRLVMFSKVFLRNWLWTKVSSGKVSFGFWLLVCKNLSMSRWFEKIWSVNYSFHYMTEIIKFVGGGCVMRRQIRSATRKMTRLLRPNHIWPCISRGVEVWYTD